MMVGPWPPTKGGVTTFMRNVVRSPLGQKYDFIPFTTSRPGKRNVRRDNYGYAAVFRGGVKRVLQGIAITLWHLVLYPWVVLVRRRERWLVREVRKHPPPDQPSAAASTSRTSSSSKS